MLSICKCLRAFFNKDLSIFIAFYCIRASFRALQA